MTRTAILNKEDILKATFKILNRHGIEGITIRAIAKELGRSTAPIYTQYKNMELLMCDLKNYSKNKLIGYTKREYAVDPFLNIGVGIIDFVLENRKVFRYYYLTSNNFLFNPLHKQEDFLNQMKSNGMLSILEDQILLSLLDEMWIYTYGLATSICTGAIKDKPLVYYIDRLGEMGHNLISYHLYSTGSYEAYFQKFVEKVSKHVSIKEVLES